MVKMRDAALAAVLAVLAGAGICAAMPMELKDDLGAKEFAPYKLIRNEETYEVREYEPAVWACTKESKIKSKTEMMVMFLKMFHYIYGGNSLDEDMHMTAPMTMHKEMTDMGAIKKIEICYYLPSTHQADPPIPTEKEISIEKRGSMRVAVRSFMGMKPSMDEWEMEKLMLLEDLKEAGVKVDHNNCYGTKYYAPKGEMVNEVWYRLDE